MKKTLKKAPVRKSVRKTASNDREAGSLATQGERSSETATRRVQLALRKRSSVVSAARIEHERRSAFNPVRDLNPQKLARALEQFSAGQLGAAAKLFSEINERDDFIISVQAKRVGKINSLDWEIVGQGDDAELSAAQTKILTDFFYGLEVTNAVDLNRTGCIQLLIDQMLDALACKYSVHEIIWKPEGDTLKAELRFVPLWFFENASGKLRFLEATNVTHGADLEENGWLVCAHKYPLMKPAAIAYLYKTMAWKDWVLFSRNFGMPTPVGYCSSGRGTPEWSDFAEVLADLYNGASALIDADSKIDFLKVDGGNAPMKDIVELANRSLSIIWLGSDLGTMSNQNGAGASLQGESETTLEDSDVQLVEEAIAHQLVKPVIEYFYPKGSPIAAKFTLKRNTEDEEKQQKNIDWARDNGCYVEKDVVYEAAKLPKPAVGANLAVPPSPLAIETANEKTLPGDVSAGLIELAQKQNENLEPLYSALQKIADENLSPEDRAERLAKFNESIAGYFGSNKLATETWEKTILKALEDNK